MVKKTFVPRPPESPEVIEARWKKKKERIEELSNGIRRLRTNVSRDISQQEDEKKFLTALVIAVMDITAERIGNDSSEAQGHIGITGLQEKNITISGNSVTLDYVGKSGVKHEKCFTDERIAKGLKRAIKNSPSKYIFETTKGIRIKSGQVNKYLEEFKISSKNLRGYAANKWTLEKLKLIEPEETDKKRKKQINKILQSVAAKVGHGRPTLRKHYLIPELWDEWVNNGKVIDISDLGYMKNGGETPKNSDIDNYEKTSNFVINPTKDELRNIISGDGEVSQGAAIKTIANYLRGSEKASSLVGKFNDRKEHEAKILRDYINKNNLWFPNINRQNRFDGGGEQDVYLVDAQTVIKTNDAVFYSSWLEYLNNLLLHNYYFPANEYELLGFTEDRQKLESVVKQRFVKPTEKTNLNNVKIFLRKNGFINRKELNPKYIAENDYYNSDLGVKLDDLHEKNVLTENGVLQFIDTNFYLDNTFAQGGDTKSLGTDSELSNTNVKSNGGTVNKESFFDYYAKHSGLIWQML